ncbi:MAG: flagellar protein FlbB [Methylobacterium sp.]|nr:flagellar protein FlbB [Methylobacterium sp.]MCA3655082.1 flagellar protein FlbB [Methylobacterium sp.]MCA3659263.1 flagellar protein FlbB [Methylobacterium sp.]MCA3662154.1 flagellar protein FlbB [Methylobacterium sp.]MCA3664685.1 flagellar protein FlbB [Methylobacterium sp.]
MTRIRLIPVLIFGLVSLLTIRVLSVALDNRPLPQIADFGLAAGDRFARSIERARLGAQADNQIITGSTGNAETRDAEGRPADSKAAGAQAQAPTASGAPKIKPDPEGTRVHPPPAQIPERGQAASPAEREILERLQARRTEIEAKNREIEMRDSLLRTTERKLDEKIGQLRTLENQFDAGQAARNDPKQRFKPLVTMYETMKPKEAARVFDRLDIKVLMDLVQQMNPRKVAEILAAMEPAAAERLTVALARQAQNVSEVAAPAADGELPRLSPPTR